MPQPLANGLQVQPPLTKGHKCRLLHPPCLHLLEEGVSETGMVPGIGPQLGVLSSQRLARGKPCHALVLLPDGRRLLAGCCSG